MSFFRNLRQFFADPQTREFLAWCLPALLLGVALRTVLLWQEPYGIYHVDTPDFLTTPDRLIHDHAWELHGKKTFLVPILFTVPFLLHLNALIFIPLMQHLLGLATIVMVGLLCRCWFAWWKLFIIPLTLIPAIDPFVLWYERTLMAETTFLFCTVLLVLAGTLYALRGSRGRFILLCVAQVLEAGARPEGKLLFGFGLLLLVLLHFRAWRTQWPRFAILVVLAGLTHLVTHTSQAGLLLYTSVARLTPPNLKIAPGFDAYIDPVRTDLQNRWGPIPSFPKVRDRRLVSDAVKRYLDDHPEVKRVHSHEGVNGFCLKLARETCRRNLPALPDLVYHKFRFTAWDAPSGLFNQEWVFDRQHSAYGEALDRATHLSVGITGHAFSTPAEFEQFVNQHYGSVPWFNDWAKVWLRTVNYFHFPDALDTTRRNDQMAIYYGVPYYFLLAAAGVAFSMFRRGTLQPLYVAWGLALFGLFFTIILTANIKPRFRFVFEPFWFIYIALIFDSVILALQTLLCRITEPSAPETTEPATP